MQSETGFPSSHQLKSYVASKSRLKLAARAVLSADADLLVTYHVCEHHEDVAHVKVLGCRKKFDDILVKPLRINVIYR